MLEKWRVKLIYRVTVLESDISINCEEIGMILSLENRLKLKLYHNILTILETKKDHSVYTKLICLKKLETTNSLDGPIG